MIRTVIAVENETIRNIICETFEKNGVAVRYRCRTGAEAIRAIKKMGGGIVICGYKFPDMTADELAYDLKGAASLLVVAKPAQLCHCEDEALFRLPVPVKTGELIGAVNMLIQMDKMRCAKTIPRRSPEDTALIQQAKMILMEKSNLSEDSAYRYLQRTSMEKCVKLTETAKLIIAAFE